jgi:hypothetical protein
VELEDHTVHLENCVNIALQAAGYVCGPGKSDGEIKTEEARGTNFPLSP